MAWTSALALDGAWIDIRYEGRVTPAELEAAFHATIALVRIFTKRDEAVDWLRAA